MTSNIPAQEFVVISDLHIGGGRANPTWADLELFRADEPFSQFADALIRRTQEERIQLTLIILGDLFDFPRVFPAGTDATNSDSDAIARLECIRDGHPALLDDLGRLVEAGIALVIVPGNHDRALARPAVFDHLRAMIAPDASQSIRCEPWHVFEPGVLYAEHGQQYHDINAFERLLEVRSSALSHAVPTIGGAIDNLMRASARRATALGDAPPETVAGAIRVMGSSPRFAAHLARPAFDLAVAVLRSGTNTVFAHPSRTRYRAHLAAQPDTERQLAPESLVGIEIISERRRRSTWRRLVTVAINAASGRSGRAGATQDPRSLQAGRQIVAAREIDAVLRMQGEEVPIYVMGHTHVASVESISSGPGGARLINTGTWIDNSESGNGNDGYPYAIIRSDPTTATVAGSLRRWNPIRGQIDGP